MPSSVECLGSVPSRRSEPEVDDYTHIRGLLEPRYGEQANAIVHDLLQRERQRHAGQANVLRIGAPRDVFARNLRALEYVASGKAAAPPEALEQLYADAVNDLRQAYPPVEGDMDWFAVWKHCLDVAIEQAQKHVRPAP